MVAFSLTLPKVRLPPRVPLAFTTETVWASVRSRSLKVIVPVSVNVVPATAASSVTAPRTSVVAVVIVGTSLVPVMFTAKV